MSSGVDPRAVRPALVQPPSICGDGERDNDIGVPGIVFSRVVVSGNAPTRPRAVVLPELSKMVVVVVERREEDEMEEMRRRWVRSLIGGKGDGNAEQRGLSMMGGDVVPVGREVPRSTSESGSK